MAKKIGSLVQPALIDGAIAVGGAGLIDTYVVGNVELIQTAMANIPEEISGIPVRIIVYGAVALIAARYFMK